MAVQTAIAKPLPGQQRQQRRGQHTQRFCPWRWAPWTEALRLLATALLPLLSGQWFGDSRLDGYIAWVIAALFGLSALALPWVVGGQPAASLPGRAAPG